MVSNINDINSDVNSNYNIDDLILKILNSKSFVQLKELVKELKNINKNLSLSTLHRHLDDLIDDSKIIRIIFLDFEQYGINNKDQRASYYALSKYKEFPRYNSILIESLKSSDPIKKKMALVEIESMKQIALLPNHLAELGKMLKEENDYEIKQAVLRILYNNFLNFIFPLNLKDFEENLIEFLKITDNILEKRKYLNAEERVKDENTKSHTLYLLGLLNSYAVIESLKKDVASGKDVDTLEREGYTAWTLAKIIDDNRADLLEFQNKLAPDNIKVLQDIRIRANGNLHTIVGGLNDSAYNHHITIFKSKGLQI